MSDTERAIWWLVFIPVAMFVVPPLIARLPEPPDVALPEPGSSEETALHRQLRAEGPKVLYRDIAAEPRLLVWIAVIVAGLGACARQGLPTTAGWAATALTPVFALLWVVDWRTRLLPRIVVRPLTALILVVVVLEWVLHRDTHLLVRELVGGALAWLVFGLMWFVKRAGMGLGDVRLALPLGILTSSFSWNAWLLSLYAGFLAFAAFALVLIMSKRDRAVLKRAYPFGPFMIAGGYAGIALAPHLHLIG